MNLLVTGAAGFIGYHVSKSFLNKGEKVIGFDNINDYYDPRLKKARLEILNQYENFTFYQKDLTDFNGLKEIFATEKIEKVCHLAAQAGVRYSLANPLVYQKSNLEGFINILEIAKEAKVSNFVYASSSSVYANNTKIPFDVKDPVDFPISLYAATKRANELMAYTYSYQFNIPTTGLRFFTVYGPWGRPDMSYFKFAEAITSGKEIDIYNFGDMQRDFTYIDDITDGIISALEKESQYEIFNLGNSDPVNLEDFIGELEKCLGIPAKKRYLPMQPGDVPRTFADISHSTDKLGYCPKIKVPEGLKRFIEWYLEYKKQ